MSRRGQVCRTSPIKPSSLYPTAPLQFDTLREDGSSSFKMDPSELPPPSTWQYVPSGFPPAGQTINFTDPEDRGYILIVVGSVLTALMVIIFCIRTYVKIFILKRLQWDDCTWMAMADWLRPLTKDTVTCTIAFFGALTYFGAVTWSMWQYSLQRLYLTEAPCRRG